MTQQHDYMSQGRFFVAVLLLITALISPIAVIPQQPIIGVTEFVFIMCFICGCFANQQDPMDFILHIWKEVPGAIVLLFGPFASSLLAAMLDQVVPMWILFGIHILIISVWTGFIFWLEQKDGKVIEAETPFSDSHLPGGIV